MKRRLSVVLDSNILISALVFGGKPRDIVDLGFKNLIDLITSHFISEEVRRGLVKLGHGVDEAEVIIAAYESAAEIVYLEDIVPLSRDQNDDPIIATAVAGRADYIVTGDKDLLVLKRVGRVNVVSPAEFFKVYEH